MKLVMIEWVDSCSHAGQERWKKMEEIAADEGVVRCRSVGWLVGDHEDNKVIVPHISGMDGNDLPPYGRGDLSIPTKAITKITVLRGKSGRC